MPHLARLEDRLRELGYRFHVDGQEDDVRDPDTELEYRWVEAWEPEAIAAEAGALVADGFGVIVTSGSVLTLAVMRLTSTIPIVMICDDGDCVGSGIVASLDRPGGNVTGSTSAVSRLCGKRLEILREAAPGTSRVGVLYNPDVPDKVSDLMGLTETAERLQIPLVLLAARHPADIPPLFDVAMRERVDALLTLSDSLIFRRRKQIAELATQNRLPAIYTHRASVEAGGLMAYGPNMADLYARAAEYVDKILCGAKPAALPVGQPTSFEFTFNPAAAQSLGLRLPKPLLSKVEAYLP